VAGLVLAAATPAQALTVYAASSLREAFPAIDGSPKYSFAASNTLQIQIEHGAPADVFASASPKQAQALYREHRCERPVTFATNLLALLVPRGNPGHLRSVYSLRAGGRRLAVGAQAVPVGDYARTLLSRMHLSRILSVNTVSDELTAASITAKVGMRSADAGFAYITDARAASGRVSVLRLPSWAQPPVRYQACVVRRKGANRAGARRFIAEVRSHAGRATLKRHGFGLSRRG
jgi:molybdate transport system substrate-binding protein